MQSGFAMLEMGTCSKGNDARLCGAYQLDVEHDLVVGGPVKMKSFENVVPVVSQIC